MNYELSEKNIKNEEYKIQLSTDMTREIYILKYLHKLVLKWNKLMIIVMIVHLEFAMT